MRTSPMIMLCALWLPTATGVCAQADPDDADGPVPGRYTTTFTERSPLSTVGAVTERFRFELDGPLADYVLEDESFEVYVPQDYDGSEPYGLIVWINAGERGAPPIHYLPVLDQHNLIWIGAKNSGNPRSFWHRAGLALDGLCNIKQSHNIDPMRIYVSGISGGGRCSSRIGPTYADQFAGAFPIIGVDFFKRLPHPDSKQNTVKTLLKFWAPAFNPPSPRILRRAKRDGRYVLLTGETDGNRAQTLVTYVYGYQRAKFKNITYLEVPGMGHTLPPAEWFEKGIVALDAPLEEVRDRRETEAGRAYGKAIDTLKRSPKHGIAALQDLLRDYADTTYALKTDIALQDALANQPETPEPPTAEQDQKPPHNKAREDLAMAKNYLAAGRTDLARGLLNGLIERYPESEEAEKAGILLEDITAP
jgi:hypothetical protein